MSSPKPQTTKVDLNDIVLWHDFLKETGCTKCTAFNYYLGRGNKPKNWKDRQPYIDVLQSFIRDAIHLNIISIHSAQPEDISVEMKQPSRYCMSNDTVTIKLTHNNKTISSIDCKINLWYIFSYPHDRELDTLGIIIYWCRESLSQL
jgi:hypothetical protein